jgi:hypothetical protein
MCDNPMFMVGKLGVAVKQLCALRTEIRDWYNKKFPDNTFPGYHVALVKIRETPDTLEDSQNVNQDSISLLKGASRNLVKPCVSGQIDLAKHHIDAAIAKLESGVPDESKNRS